MYIDDIKTASPFRDLFSVRKRILEDIMWDMRKNGCGTKKAWPAS